MTGTLAGYALRDMVAAWLPSQRWFPGRGATVSELTIVSDVTLLEGDPQLRHLVVEAEHRGGGARFQVLIGCRSQLPAAIAPGAVLALTPGFAVYDALHDPELAAVLLDGIAAGRREGPLRFVREPGARLGDWRTSRLMTAEQSNTSLVFGEAAIMKVLRRLFPGANPDLEVADALARLGSARVAAPFGWIETVIDGEPVLLAVLSEYLSHARDGWTLAGDGLARLYARQGGYGREYLTAPVAPELAAGPEAADLPFVAEAGELGRATAQMHAEMAAAFGTREMTAVEWGELAGTLLAKLSEAVALVPELRPYAPKIAAAYEALAGIGQPVPVQRIHGDYHLGQVMYSQHGWVALDFEGEPAAPLSQRRALAPALRDVAGMLRSFDYAARHKLVGQPHRQELAATASAWVGRCEQAFRAGYAVSSGADPSDQATMLRALTLEKAVYEVIYEHRHRPDWLSIPLDYVAAA
jgi:maltokinase